IMSSNAGIQELMQAETRASQIVAEARVGRGDRLKQAKEEADGVISQFRSEKEVEFNTALLSVGGSDSQSSSALKQDTEREMHLQKSQFEQNSGKALQVLLAKCCEVDLEVPAARIRSAQKAA
ncbi:hypothetical protein TL16_g02010, partial [Triparma laevis f. inornata]